MTDVPLQPPPAGAHRDSDRLHGLDVLRATSPMIDAVIEEIDGRADPGRRPLVDRLRVLQLPRLRPRTRDHRRDRRSGASWGTHPSWSRLLGNPRLYPDHRERLTELLGAPDTLVLPTVTLIHMGRHPDPRRRRDGAGRGPGRTRPSTTAPLRPGAGLGHGPLPRGWTSTGSTRGCRPAARVRGWSVSTALNSMTGNIPICARTPASAVRTTRSCTSTTRTVSASSRAGGTRAVGTDGGVTPSCAPRPRLRQHRPRRWLLQGVLVAAGLPRRTDRAENRFKSRRRRTSTQDLTDSVVGHSPRWLRRQRARGDAIRTRLHGLTARVLDHVRALGFATPNTTGTPIVETAAGPRDDLAKVAGILWDTAIYLTLASYRWCRTPRSACACRSPRHTPTRRSSISTRSSRCWPRRRAPYRPQW